ncbi:MAG: hypothetical protein JXQ73_16900 [Phycisphaerae bacterium]|nr:hypothetical protein [Phycisphaerae bacterium]
MNRLEFLPGRSFAIAVALVAFGSSASVVNAGEAMSDLVLVCLAQNDLHLALTASGVPCTRCDTTDEAIGRAREGAAVLILADGYPDKTTDLPPALVEKAAGKKLRMYVEYPSSLAGIEVGKPRGTQWERAVVASDVFGEDLAKLRILAINDCHFTPIKADKAHIVVARVAGFETAVFGLPKETFPILFEHPKGNLLVATTKLSQFVTARYAPTAAWDMIWQAIFKWLRPGQPPLRLKWTATVRPSFSADEPLPDDVERKALARGVAWFKNARLLVHPSWKDKVEQRRKDYHDGVAPAPPADWPIGDGKEGVLEGQSSIIRYDGTQPLRWYLRNDCTGEVSMGFALGGGVLAKDEYKTIGGNLNDFIYTNSVFAKGPRGDPKSSSYGLLSWSDNPPADGIYYGDDNARSMLGTMAAAAVLDSDRWDEGLLRCLLANLRTCGKLGFRGGRLDEAGLQRHGWRHYFGGSVIHYAPHYESYLWACYLWAYRHTGYDLFLQRAKTAIRMTMKAYPDQWRWTNGIQQERARMLLCLAWLVRVEDTPEHRQWLEKMVGEVLRNQVACGAIREELGGPGKGSYGPPRSNEDYGKSEATLMQANGDPLCDLLYTTNFAFIGLHEAAVATGEKRYVEAMDKLTKFLCRIQVRSETHPELDGAWFRAFDFRRWEFWASNADVGWGAWSIETGWTQGWITAVLALREMKTSLWDLTAGSKIGEHMDKLRPMMIPDEAIAELPKPRPPVKHTAIGKQVTLATPPDDRYPGGGANGLIDGARAVGEHTDGHWLGFEGPDLDATIDLGEMKPVRSISSGYLQSTPVGIYMPIEVTYSVSHDGLAYRTVATLSSDVSVKTEGPLVKDFAGELSGVEARYVRVRAKNIGTIPAGNRAAGRKAWLFVDEILIR